LVVFGASAELHATITIARGVHRRAVTFRLIDLLDDAAASTSPDYLRIGEQLTAKYGPATALCAVRVAWQHFGTSLANDGGIPVAKTAMANSAPASSSTRSRRIATLDWLVHHESDWVRLRSGS